MSFGRIAALLSAVDEVHRTYGTMAGPVTVLALEKPLALRRMSSRRSPTASFVARHTARFLQAVEVERLGNVVPLAVAEVPQEGPAVAYGVGRHAVLATELIKPTSIGLAGRPVARRFPVEVSLATELVPRPFLFLAPA